MKNTTTTIVTVMMSIIMSMLFISLVSATEYIGRQYEDINIVDTCVVSGFPCPASYLCNITISDPDQKLIILNQPMTRNDTVYNYTFTVTDVLGYYAVNIYCDNSTFSGNEESTLWVTTTGREPNVMITILLLICSLGLFLLALYLKNHAIGFISGILFVIAGVYIMIYGLGDLADMYTRSIALVVIAFGAFVTLLAGIEWLEDLDG